jgi:hypothetical protein
MRTKPQYLPLYKILMQAMQNPEVYLSPTFFLFHPLTFTLSSIRRRKLASHTKKIEVKKLIKINSQEGEGKEEGSINPVMKRFSKLKIKALQTAPMEMQTSWNIS